MDNETGESWEDVARVRQAHEDRLDAQDRLDRMIELGEFESKHEREQRAHIRR